MSTPDRRDDVDELLRAAGQAWRDAEPSPPAPDTSRLRPGRSRARWVPVLAAACVIAVALAIAVIKLSAASAPSGPDRSSGDRPRYLVKDGDRVEVTGMVVAAPGRPVVYCPPLPTTGESEAQAPGCGAELAITLSGVDLGRLAEPSTSGGVRSGYARMRGVWTKRSIAVDEQSVPPVDALTGPPDVDTVPCAEPAGGWPVPDPPRSSLPSTVAVRQYVEQHPDRFGATWVAFPQGMTRPTAAWTVPAVLVVDLVQGDPEEARKELQPKYDGPVCVSPGRVTRDRLVAAAHAGESLLFDTRNGIWESSGVGPTDELTATDGPIKVELLVVDERLYGEYQRIGLDLFDLRPAVKRIP